MNLLLRASGALFCLALLMSMPGCGEPKVKIKGKLLKEGQPYLEKGKAVTLTFVEDQKDGKRYLGRYKPDDGSYEVELRPGKYTVRYLIGKPEPGSGEVMIASSPEERDKVHDLSKNQDFNIEIKGK